MYKPVLVILILICSIMNHANCVKLESQFAVSYVNRTELKCNYSFEDNEIFNRAIWRKDGITFLEYTKENEKTPTFTNPKGITDEVVRQGGCRCTFMQTKDETLGLYEITVFYDITGKVNPKTPGMQSISNKYRLTRLGACKETWVKGKVGEIPSNAWVAATNSQGKKLMFCKGTDENKLTPGTLTDKGCEVTMSNRVDVITDFEVLTGSGFQWVKHTGSSDSVPKYSMQCGNDGSARVFMGRCYLHDNVFLGKIAGTFYYAYNNAETKDCDSHEIVLCKGN